MKLLELTLERHKAFKLYPRIGLELEFYLRDEHSENCLSSLPAGVSVVPESGVGQYELRFDHTDAVVELVQQVAAIKSSLGDKANFEAKPHDDRPGSGMHIHLNYVDADGNNVFVDESGQESELMLHAAGGMCHWMASHMIFFAPKPESYKRLADPGRETPIKINWGGNNRTAAIRVPDTNNKRQFKRLEHRVPCADCEPDVAIAAVLASALYGIKHRIAPPQKTYGLSFEEQYGLESLPLSFEEAVSRSRGVEEALG